MRLKSYLLAGLAALLVAGPAREPLAEIPIVVDAASGRIFLRT